MTHFNRLSPDLIEDEAGSLLEILGRTGLKVILDGKNYSIDSEMLAPPMSIVVYKSSVSPNANSSTLEVLQFAYAALRWAGFSIEVI